MRSHRKQPSSEAGIKIAIAGLGFGAAFVPIYLHHPDVSAVGIIDPDRARLETTAARFDVYKTHTSLEAVLDSDDYDAIHLMTPIPLHARQTIAVLESGRHCACTVPMATSLADLTAIISAQQKCGKNYMMMETTVYTRQYFYVRDLVNRGMMGRIQFLRGAHYQDMENWPSYWAGLPPMWYATHAIAPCLAIADTRATKVHCFGSGVMREELQKQYGNPFPIETAIFELEKPNLAMELTRSLFHTSRQYTESFQVYGEKLSFEWPQIEKEDHPVIFTMESDYAFQSGERGLPQSMERVVAGDRQDLLPAEIARFTVRGTYDDTNPQKTFETGGSHHGAHPHLAHEFIRSIVENRKPWIDEIRAADWTAAGICAHQSALNNGTGVCIPAFDRG